MSQSAMNTLMLTPLRYDWTVDRANQGAKTALFKPELVSLYTILISVTSFGTTKKEVSETTFPLAMYLFCLTLSCFF